jgi:hypothetical protein
MGAYFTFMLLYGAHVMRFDYIYVCIGISLMFQALSLRAGSAMLERLDTSDFSVYRLSPGERQNSEPVCGAT